ncbi:MAG: VCBS repeat-containing protein, partial [Nanoarchaeota archaeon]|nr:VCBS repeat-containing protein [Nanoarchaeota archaeon]
MKQNNKKRGVQILIISILLLITIETAYAIPTYSLSNMYDAAVPKQQKIDPIGNFIMNQFTGSESYIYPIEVPKGVNGLNPKLNLIYSSLSTTSKPTQIGTAWFLTQNYIQRDVNGTFDNVSDDKFKLYFNDNSYDLIYNSTENAFHTKIESFMLIQNKTGTNNTKQQYWELRTKDGTNYRFGFNNYSELTSNAYNNNYSVRWYLDQVNDTYNNKIYYFYKENPYVNDSGAVYLDKILYNVDTKREIQFGYEISDRPDIWRVYEDGIINISESRRLKEILILANSNLVRRYVINYNTVHLNTKTFLVNITKYGSDNSTALPATKFSYNNLTQKNWNYEGKIWQAPDCNSSGYTGCFARSGGDDNGIRISDINGDGLVDLVRANSCDNAPAQAVWINNGTGFVRNYNWQVPDYFLQADSHGYCDEGAILADVNGDGLPDFVKANPCVTSGSQTKTYINNGTGWNEDSHWLVPGCTGGDTSGCFLIPPAECKSNGLVIEDINGDGFADIVKSNGRDLPSTKIWINNGTGWVVNTNWKVPKCDYSTSTFDSCIVENTQFGLGIEGAKLIDLNGDGLPDFFKANGQGSPSSGSFINNGTGWVENKNWISPGCTGGGTSGCFVQAGDPIDSVCNGKGGATRMADVNGDGLIDIVYSDGSPYPYGPYYYYKVWINNGNGWNDDTNWKIKCGPGTNNDQCFIGPGSDDGQCYDSGIRIMDINGNGLPDIIRGDGRGGYVQSGWYNLTWINNNSKPYLLNNITNEFGGIISIDYITSTSLNNTGTDNLNDLGFNLWLVKNVTKDNKMTDSHNIQSIDQYNYTGGFYDYRNKEFKGFNVVENINPNKTKTINYYKQDNVTYGEIYKTEIYDDQNNIYKKIEYLWNGTPVSGYFVKELRGIAEYSYDGNSNNPKIKNTTNYYDSYGNINSTNNLGDVDIDGDEYYQYFEYLYNTNNWIVSKLKHSYINDANGNKIRESFFTYDGLNYGDAPVNGSLTGKEDWINAGNNAVTNYTYDSYGNIVNQTDPNGNNISYIYGRTDTTYTYVDQVKDSKSHITNYSYDLGSGVLLYSVDSNGVKTNYTYDRFYRPLKEIQPLDSASYPTKEYNYTFDGIPPEKIEISQRMESGRPDTFNTSTFYDGFGNVIQVKKDAEDPSKQIVQDMFYDNLTRIIRQTNPYTAAFSNSYTTPDSNANSTIYSYDIIDRIRKIINPDDSEKEFVYDHWNTSVYDENNNRITYYFDVFNRITNISEFNGNDIYITNYEYIPTGELVIINDSQGNIFNFTYDSLGRKIQSNDPDLGQWNYTYDKTGNLIVQVDAKGIITSMKYDSLNRIVEKNTSISNITYIYDIGKNNTLSQVRIYDGITNTTINYTYDDKLRKIKEIKIINNNLFMTNITYTSSDNILSEVTPNGLKINYTYNNQNLLGSINNIADIKYNEFDKPNNKTFFNDITTNYTYDKRIRLTRITTNDKQKLNYTYDDTNNIITISNMINSTTESMTYDNLNRLLTSIKKNSSEGVIFNFTYLYNKIGNLLNINSSDKNITYYYEQGPKHAPSKLIYYSSIALQVSDVILNASDNPNNTTNANLTTYWTVTSSSNVKNITNWYLNNKSIQLLNMPFEGGSTSSYTKDYSGFNNNGVVSSAYWNSTGGHDNFGAYQFDGINDFINLSSKILTGTNLTYGGWIKWSSIANDGSTYDAPMGQGDYGYEMYTDTSDQVYCWNGLSTAGYPITINTWYHIICMHNDTKMCLYVDGINRSCISSSIPSSSNKFYIGSYTEANLYWFNGSIDDVMIFNRSLSSQQIKLLYLEHKTINSCDSITGWINSVNAENPSLNDTEKTEGLYSIDMGKNGTANNYIVYNKTISSMNFYGRKLYMDLYIENLSELEEGPPVEVIFGTNSNNIYFV